MSRNASHLSNFRKKSKQLLLMPEIDEIRFGIQFGQQPTVYMKETLSGIVVDPNVDIGTWAGVTRCNRTKKIYFPTPLFLENPHGTFEISRVEGTGCGGLAQFVIYFPTSTPLRITRSSTSFGRSGICVATRRS